MEHSYEKVFLIPENPSIYAVSTSEASVDRTENPPATRIRGEFFKNILSTYHIKCVSVFMFRYSYLKKHSNESFFFIQGSSSIYSQNSFKETLEITENPFATLTEGE